MVPHSWIIEYLEIYGVAENIVTLLSDTINHWKTTLIASETKLAEVKLLKKESSKGTHCHP